MCISEDISITGTHSLLWFQVKQTNSYSNNSYSDAFNGQQRGQTSDIQKHSGGNSRFSSITASPGSLHIDRERERERVWERQKYTPWCAGVGTLLSGVVLGIKSAWGWERVAATLLRGLKTHFKFCWDDMSRPPLRLCWQGWQLASFYETNLKVAESQSIVAYKLFKRV